MRIHKSFLVSFPAIILFFLFALLSGLRDGGFDYEHYVIMIEDTISGSTLVDKLIIAKDPLFGFVVHLVNPTTDNDYYRVFITFSMLGFLGKLVFRDELGYGFPLFVFIYILFMAPALDYAAIRAMVGLSFLVAAFKYQNKNLILYLLFALVSVSAHISMLVPLVIGNKLSIRFIGKKPALVFLFIIAGAVFSRFILSYFPNTHTYIDKTGSLASVLPILISITALFLYWISIFRVYSTKNSGFHKRLFYVSTVLFLGSLFLAPIVVVAAYRFHQIAQFTFLICLLMTSHRFLLERKQRLMSLIFVLILLCLPMAYKNYSQELWSTMLESTSFSASDLS